MPTGASRLLACIFVSLAYLVHAQRAVGQAASSCGISGTASFGPARSTLPGAKKLAESCSQGEISSQRDALLVLTAQCAGPDGLVGSLALATSSPHDSVWVAERSQRFMDATGVGVQWQPGTPASTPPAAAPSGSIGTGPTLGPSLPPGTQAGGGGGGGAASGWDGWVGSASSLGDLIEAGRLQSLSSLVGGDARLAWAAFPRAMRMAVEYDGEVMALPLQPSWRLPAPSASSPGPSLAPPPPLAVPSPESSASTNPGAAFRSPLLLLFRRDVLEAEGLAVPQTWPQLVEAAAKLHGRDLNGDGLPDAGVCGRWYQGCPGALAPFAYAMIAPYLQSGPYESGIHFCTASVTSASGGVPVRTTVLQPLLSNPAVEEALGWLFRLRALSPPDPTDPDAAAADPAAAQAACGDPRTQPFLEGRCAFAVGTFLDFKAASHASAGPANGAFSLRGRLGAAILPGATRILPRDSACRTPASASLLGSLAWSHTPASSHSATTTSPPGSNSSGTAPGKAPGLAEGEQRDRSLPSRPPPPQPRQPSGPPPAHLLGPNAGPAGPTVALALTNCSRTLCPNTGNATTKDEYGVDRPVNRAPYFALTTWAVAASAPPVPALFAFYLGSELSGLSPAANAAALDPRSVAVPVFAAQMATALWAQAGYDAGDAAAALGALRATLEHPNPAFELRLRGQGAYSAIFNAILSDLVTARNASHTFLHDRLLEAQAALAAAFNSSADPDLLSAYRRSISRAPAAPPARARNPPPPASAGAVDPGAIQNGALPDWAVTVISILGVVLVVLVAVLLVRNMRSSQSFRRYKLRKAPGPGPDTTLLLSDIADSTALWEVLPAQVMDLSVRLHSMAVRHLLMEHRGYESATEGDAFIAAFDSPLAALNFATGLQVVLLSLEWPDQLLARPEAAPAYAVPAVALSAPRRRRTLTGGGGGLPVMLTNQLATDGLTPAVSYGPESLLLSTPFAPAAAGSGSLRTFGVGSLPVPAEGDESGALDSDDGSASRLSHDDGSASRLSQPLGSHAMTSAQSQHRGMQPRSGPATQFAARSLPIPAADSGPSGSDLTYAQHQHQPYTPSPVRRPYLIAYDKLLRSQSLGAVALAGSAADASHLMRQNPLAAGGLTYGGAGAATGTVSVASAGSRRGEVVGARPRPQSPLTLPSARSSNAGGLTEPTSMAAELRAPQLPSTSTSAFQASAAGLTAGDIPAPANDSDAARTPPPGHSRASTMAGVGAVAWSCGLRQQQSSLSYSSTGTVTDSCALYGTGSSAVLVTPSTSLAPAGGTGGGRLLSGAATLSRLAKGASADWRSAVQNLPVRPYSIAASTAAAAATTAVPCDAAAAAATTEIEVAPDPTGRTGRTQAEGGNDVSANYHRLRSDAGSAPHPGTLRAASAATPVPIPGRGEPDLGRQCWTWHSRGTTLSTSLAPGGGSRLAAPGTAISSVTAPMAAAADGPDDSPPAPLPSSLRPAAALLHLPGIQSSSTAAAAPYGNDQPAVETAGADRTSEATRSSGSGPAQPDPHHQESHLEYRPSVMAVLPSIMSVGSAVDGWIPDARPPPSLRGSWRRTGSSKMMPEDDGQAGGETGFASGPGFSPFAAFAAAALVSSPTDNRASPRAGEPISGRRHSDNAPAAVSARAIAAAAAPLPAPPGASGGASDTSGWAAAPTPVYGLESSYDTSGPSSAAATGAERDGGGAAQAGGAQAATGRSRSRRHAGRKPSLDFIRKLYARAAGGLSASAGSFGGAIVSPSAYSRDRAPDSYRLWPGDDDADFLVGRSSRHVRRRPGGSAGLASGSQHQQGSSHQGVAGQGNAEAGSVSYLSYMRRLWHNDDGSHPEALLIHRGLRLRLGLHTGLAVPSDVAMNRATGRAAYSGVFMAVAREVSNAGPGGCVMLSESARLRLVARGAFKPSSAVGVIYMGHFDTSAPAPTAPLPTSAEPPPLPTSAAAAAASGTPPLAVALAAASILASGGGAILDTHTSGGAADGPFALAVAGPNSSATPRPLPQTACLPSPGQRPQSHGPLPGPMSGRSGFQGLSNPSSPDPDHLSPFMANSLSPLPLSPPATQPLPAPGSSRMERLLSSRHPSTAEDLPDLNIDLPLRLPASAEAALTADGAAADVSMLVAMAASAPTALAGPLTERSRERPRFSPAPAGLGGAAVTAALLASLAGGARLPVATSATSLPLPRPLAHAYAFPHGAYPGSPLYGTPTAPHLHPDSASGRGARARPARDRPGPRSQTLFAGWAADGAAGQDNTLGPPPGRALYQVTGGPSELFTARLVLQPPLTRAGRCALLGSPAAPLRGPALAVAEVQVQGAGAILAWNLDLGTEALQTCLAAMQRLAALHAGGAAIYLSTEDQTPGAAATGRISNNGGAGTPATDTAGNSAAAAGGGGGGGGGGAGGGDRSAPSHSAHGATAGFTALGRLTAVSDDAAALLAWAADLNAAAPLLPWRDELLVNEYCAELAIVRHASGDRAAATGPPSPQPRSPRASLWSVRSRRRSTISGSPFALGAPGLLGGGGGGGGGGALLPWDSGLADEGSREPRRSYAGLPVALLGRARARLTEASGGGSGGGASPVPGGGCTALAAARPPPHAVPSSPGGRSAAHAAVRANPDIGLPPPHPPLSLGVAGFRPERMSYDVNSLPLAPVSVAAAYRSPSHPTRLPLSPSPIGIAPVFLRVSAGAAVSGSVTAAAAASGGAVGSGGLGGMRTSQGNLRSCPSDLHRMGSWGAVNGGGDSGGGGVGDRRVPTIDELSGAASSDASNERVSAAAPAVSSVNAAAGAAAAASPGLADLGLVASEPSGWLSGLSQPLDSAARSSPANAPPPLLSPPPSPSPSPLPLITPPRPVGPAPPSAELLQRPQHHHSPTSHSHPHPQSQHLHSHPHGQAHKRRNLHIHVWGRPSAGGAGFNAGLSEAHFEPAGAFSEGGGDQTCGGDEAADASASFVRDSSRLANEEAPSVAGGPEGARGQAGAAATAAAAAAAAATALDPAVELIVLLRGLRLRVCVDGGPMQGSLSKASGRISYRGRPQQRASRLAGEARGGTLLVTSEALEAAVPGADRSNSASAAGGGPAGSGRGGAQPGALTAGRSGRTPVAASGTCPSPLAPHLSALSVARNRSGRTPPASPVFRSRGGASTTDTGAGPAGPSGTAGGTGSTPEMSYHSYVTGGPARIQFEQMPAAGHKPSGVYIVRHSTPGAGSAPGAAPPALHAASPGLLRSHVAGPMQQAPGPPHLQPQPQPHPQQLLLTPRRARATSARTAVEVSGPAPAGVVDSGAARRERDRGSMGAGGPLAAEGSTGTVGGAAAGPGIRTGVVRSGAPYATSTQGAAAALRPSVSNMATLFPTLYE